MNLNLSEWLETIVWWLIVADCCGYNLVAWMGKEWYETKFGRYSRIFPVTKAFGVFYAALVVWLGTALYRAGAPLFGG
ncbi:MAG: hypothetical protein VB997_03610 [Opitutales bacterium]